jgi:hypothetical protein
MENNLEHVARKKPLIKIDLTDFELYVACTLLIISVVFNHQLLRENLNLKQKLEISKPINTPALSTTPTPSPFETSQEEIIESSTAGWNTYTNTDYGFSIKYPSTHYPKEAEEDVTYKTLVRFDDGKDDTINWFTVVVREWSLEQEVEHTKWLSSHVLVKLVNEQGIILNGQPATRLDYESYSSEPFPPDTFVLVFNQGYSYSISAPTAIIDQILSTFSFVEIDANWSIEVPNLPTEISWSLVSSDNQIYSNPALYWRAKDTTKSNNMTLAGVEWVATSDEQTVSDPSYQKQLRAIGWESKISGFEISNFVFYPVSAGGVLGSIDGMFYYHDNKVRVVNVGYEIDNSLEKDKIEHRIFISNIYTTEELLSLVESSI